MKIQPLIAPRSVAIVGASANDSRYGTRALANLLRFGFKGRVAAINPRAESVGVVDGFTSLKEVPWEIDHVAVAVPANSVLDVLGDCVALEVPAVTVFSNGFSETGTEVGGSLERQVRELVGSKDIVLLGPNCNGVLNIRDRIALTSTRALDDLSLYEKAASGPGVTIISQSGGLAVVNVMWRSLMAGLPVAWTVSVGNQAVVTLSDLVDAALDEDNVGAVLMVLEALPAAAQMRATARRAARAGKVLSALKIGRTSAGAQAAQSHTGSFTGDFEVFADWTRQIGIVCVEDAAELYETTMGVQSAPDGLGGGIGIASISGGNVALFADLAAASGVPIATFSPATARRLADILPPMCSPTNPLDLMTAVQDPGMFEIAMRALLDDPNVGVGVWVATFNPPGFLEVAQEIARSARKPLWVAWVGGPMGYEVDAPSLRRQGLVVYDTMSSCIKALLASQRRGDRDKNAFSSSAHLRTEPDGAAAPIDGLLATLGGRPRSVFGASAALDVVRTWGLDTVPGIRCETSDDAVSAARAIGFPVVLKVDDPGIVHKTDLDGVRMGIGSISACEEAWSALVGPDSMFNHGAPVLVQAQVENAVELFVAGHTRGQLGPMVSVGLGGVFVEILRDIVRLFPPFDAVYAKKQFRRLRGYGVLEAFRGRSAVDEDELAQWICRFGDLMCHLGTADVVIDLNPVFLPRGGGAPLIVDASIELGPETISENQSAINATTETKEINT